MTYEEALLFNQKWTAEQAFNDLERYLLRGEFPAYKAVAMGMKALTTRIPKKVIREERGCDCFCPNCLNLVGYIDALSMSGCAFCPECGQALDWGDAE